MSENVQGKQDSSKLTVILLIVLIVLVIGGIITGVLLMMNRSVDENVAEGDGEPVVTIGYENNGVVLLDEDAMKAYFGELEKAAEGMINLTFQNVAYSTDGVNFTCSLGNSDSNNYDEYLNIYLGSEMTEENQILLTGLLPPGSNLESFKSEIPLDPGEYDAILVFTQVEDDHATICGQSMVAMTLVVEDVSDDEE